MIRRLRGTAFIAMVTAAAPVWAHSPMGAEELNRQELVRLASQPPAPVAPANVVIPDPVGLIVADGIRPNPPSFPGLLGVAGLVVGYTAATVSFVATGPTPP